MKYLSAGVWVFCFILSGSYGATKVDPKVWIQNHSHTYRIQKVNSEAPKSENSLATVFADKEEGVFTMPYCPPGGVCDPGYLFFPYDKTEITETTLANGATQTKLVVSDGDVLTYFWIQKGDSVSFRNDQYSLGAGTVSLVHSLEKESP